MANLSNSFPASPRILVNQLTVGVVQVNHVVDVSPNGPAVTPIKISGRIHLAAAVQPDACPWAQNEFGEDVPFVGPLIYTPVVTTQALQAVLDKANTYYIWGCPIILYRLDHNI